jgi:hypothetical protein
MNSFKKSVTHNNSCMYYVVHKYFRGLVATNIIMSFIKYYCSGILKDNLPNWKVLACTEYSIFHGWNIQFRIFLPFNSTKHLTRLTIRFHLHLHNFWLTILDPRCIINAIWTVSSFIADHLVHQQLWDLTLDTSNSTLPRWCFLDPNFNASASKCTC